MSTTQAEPKRKRGNPMFPLLARVYTFWTDRFRHDPKVMTDSGRKRNIAAFTTAIKAQVLEANPNGVAARDFKIAVEHTKARLGPEAWQAELDKAAGRIEAAILAYADSGYHRKQAERQAASPRRHFDNWLNVAVTTWIDAARNKGLIDREGVAKHVKSRERGSGNGEPVDLDRLRPAVRNRMLASDNRAAVLRFRTLFALATAKGSDPVHGVNLTFTASIMVEKWPPDLLELVHRETSRRAAVAWGDKWQEGDIRWKYQLALFLHECLTHKGETDV